MRKVSIGVSIASALVLAAGGALADKANDTLKIAISDTFDAMSPYARPFDEAAQFTQDMYRPLLVRDQYHQKWVGDIAKSWKQVSPTTVEFELRDDILFHSGNKLSADDVVYTINWAASPKVRIPNKAAFSWVDHAEKLGPYKVAVHSKKPNALAIAALSYRFFIMDSKILKSLKDQSDFGRVSASTTGRYKMVSFDRNRGVVVERFDGYRGNKKLFRAPIRRIEGIVIPDPQTRIAELLTGGVDLLRNPTADMTRNLRTRPGIKVTVRPTGTYIMWQMDAIGRAGFDPLKDLRVRKAIVMAVDRNAIKNNFIAGGETQPLQNALCIDWNAACAYTTKPYDYNPEEARRLLAEAGYPNGFDMPFYVHTPYRTIAEAVAGQLRKVGIRSEIQPLTLGVYFKRRSEGKLPIFMGIKPTGAEPETKAILASWFAGGRDYWKDPVISKAIAASISVADDDKRGEILRPALDRVNTQAYIVPIAVMPATLIHTDKVRVEPNTLAAGATRISDYFWN